MELKALWAVIARRWLLILIPAAVAFGLTLPTLPDLLRPPTGYTAVIRFTASQPPEGVPARSFEDQNYLPWLASEYAVINLAAWTRTESFRAEVSKHPALAGLSPISADALIPAIAADSVRSILTVYLSWPDEAALRQIGEAVIGVLTARSGAYFPQFGAAPPVVKALDTVNTVPAPTPLTTRLNPLLRIVIGLVAGIGLAFLVEYLDPTIRTRHEAEAVGWPVIGEIPR